MSKPGIESVRVRGMSVNSSPPETSVSTGAEKDLLPVNPAPSRSSAGGVAVLEKWVNRIAMVLFVSLCAVFGVLLVILPWTPKWTDNYILISYPALRDFLENGFIRGACTGLGAIDIWIGFWEASHYHEHALAVESSPALKS